MRQDIFKYINKIEQSFKYVVSHDTDFENEALYSYFAQKGLLKIWSGKSHETIF